MVEVDPQLQLTYRRNPDSQVNKCSSKWKKVTVTNKQTTSKTIFLNSQVLWKLVNVNIQSINAIKT